DEFLDLTLISECPCVGDDYKACWIDLAVVSRGQSQPLRRGSAISIGEIRGLRPRSHKVPESILQAHVVPRMRSELSYEPSGFFVQSLRIRATEMGVDGAIPVARVLEIVGRQTGHVRMPDLVHRIVIIDLAANHVRSSRVGC